MNRMREIEDLFKDGAWTVKGFPQYPDTVDQIWHKCGWTKSFLNKGHCTGSSQFKKYERCRHCWGLAPASVIGVWKLNNFDSLEEHNDSADSEWTGRPGQVWEYDPRAKPPRCL